MGRSGGRASGGLPGSGDVATGEESSKAPGHPLERRLLGAPTAEALRQQQAAQLPPPQWPGGRYLPSSMTRLREVLSPHVEGAETSAPSRCRLLSPLEINFSQTHIRPDFQDGRSVEESAVAVERELFAPRAGGDLADLQVTGIPWTNSNWWLLRAPFPEIEVIQWRCKLREEDGTPKLDKNGMELYGPKEWYTLDNRRLYCLQRAAVALYPAEVRCVVLVVHQDEGNCREFRKFRTFDLGRSIGVGHRDSAELPRWSWRQEVGLPEEPLPAGSALARPSRRRGPSSRGADAASPGSHGEHGADHKRRSTLDFAANVVLFLIMYATLRFTFLLGRRLLMQSPDEPAHVF